MFALYFVAINMVRNYRELSGYFLLDTAFPITVGICIVLYSATLLLPSLGWAILLRQTVTSTVSFRAVVWLYGQTHLAKYLPGNLFHYFGRQVLGRHLGWPQSAIALASIIAKVTRDRYMLKQAEVYPDYGFVSNKGYGTPSHIAALKAFGPCKLHRMSFLSQILS